MIISMPLLIFFAFSMMIFRYAMPLFAAFRCHAATLRC